MDEGTKTRVFKVLKKVTGKDYDIVDLEKDIEAQVHLDSIQFVEFYAALEQEFNIELPLSMMTVKNRLAFFRLLDEHLSNSNN